MKGFYGIIRRRKLKNGTATFVLVSEHMFATQDSAEKAAAMFQEMCEPLPPDTLEVQHHIVFGVT